MERSIDFLRDEVRNGFYIPTAIKQAWAATLSVLDEVDRICKKHGIRYYADWGTFLGAVRHGGFVPWDDDLDICMLRDDYEKFRKVVDKEAPKEYVIHDYERKDNHWLFIARVVNNEMYNFDEEYLKTHNNFPWLAGVDIFLKDYLYQDYEQEKLRDQDVMNILALADGIIDGKISGDTLKLKLVEFKNCYNISINFNSTKRDMAVSLYRLAEQHMAKVKPYDTERVGQIFPWVLKYGFDVSEEKKRYENIIRLPFEDTTIPVPAEYNKVLESRYGIGYTEIHKVWNGHDYPFFEKQKEDIEKVSDRKLPFFTFKEAMLERPGVDNSQSLKETSIQCLNELYALTVDAENILNGGTLDELTQCVTDSEQLAADYGTLVEQVKGEKSISAINVVAGLQEYCDVLWEEYQKICNGEVITNLNVVKATLEKLNVIVKEYIFDRKEILILSIGRREWKYLSRIYEKEKSNKDTDICVISLPLMRKDMFGNIDTGDCSYETEFFNDIEFADWKIYDISIHCPDVVYIQNPYDGENPCLSVPPMYYAESIRNYTKKIIYVSPFKTDEFTKEDANDQYNLKHYVTAPGIVYADEVIVQSDNIKEQYVNALVKFAGKNTKEYWENKIKACEELYNVKKVCNNKRLLYCIGVNELSENNNILMNSVKERIDIFENISKNIDMTLAIYPSDRKIWEEVNYKLSKDFFELIDKMISDNRYQIISINPAEADNIAEQYDAYYGSPSPLVPAFVIQKKPVMISNYEE
ncbi:MAG: LicD family protein [Lachnospiraceae bacterium]|nr:LicD family protein [Lachnospiraceae bacterium]